MIYIELFLLTIIICFIIDCSGFNKSIIKLISYLTHIPIKNPYDLRIPFLTCSLCTVWWSCLIYLLIKDNLTFTTIAFSSILSLISSNISGFMMYIKELLTFIENKLYKIISEL